MNLAQRSVFLTNAPLSVNIKYTVLKYTALFLNLLLKSNYCFVQYSSKIQPFVYCITNVKREPF